MCTPNTVSLHTSGLRLPLPPSQGHYHGFKDPKIPILTFCLQCLLQLPQVEQPSTRQTRAHYPCIQILVPNRKCKVRPGLAPTHCLDILFPGISKYFHPILATSFFLYLESPSSPGIFLLLRVTAAKATPCRQHPS